VLRDHDDDLRTCYARSLRQGARRAQLQGDVQITIAINPWGHTWETHRDSASVNDNALVQCVEDVVGSWRFPAIDTQEPEIITVPIHFGKLP
jgi:hypothetical protein